MSAPFMQLYVADYLGDTQHLTTEQHGAYLLILMTMWRHGGSLPADERMLARIARVTPRRWHLIAAEIMHFFDCADGRVSQKRLVEEYQKAVSKSEKRSVCGTLGGNAKALKKQNSPLANAKQKPQHLSESDIREEANASSETRVDAPDHEREFLTAFWPAYPHKVGKPAALKAFRSARRAAELPTILDGLRRYVAGKPPDRPWCNPTTFLNQQRWADEPATVTQGIRHDAAGRSPVADTQAAILEIYAARDADRPRPPDGEGERDRDGLPGRHSADAGRAGPASGRGGAGPVLALSARDTR